jgi:voltage-gated potassium channel
VATVISVAFVLVMVAGALERIVEPDTFTSLGLAYWWAVVTVTTVGYGDVVPESTAGRLVGTGLMLRAWD